MDPRTGYIEILSDKRGTRRNLVSNLFFIIFCQFSNHRCIHTIQRSAKLRIFKNHRFQRRIAGTFTDSKQGTVHTTCSIKPGRC